MNPRLALLLLITALLASCAVTTALPTNYRGPKATIIDTVKSEDWSKGQLFVLDEVDGQSIRNATHATRQASANRGLSIALDTVRREVPARELKLRLLATHQTGAPIHEIASRAAGTFLSVSGVVTFTPKDNGTYFVVGELDKTKPCVWLAETPDGEPVSERICR